MPTVLREGPYRFFFYSYEPWEPPHIHVRRDDREVKLWLDPVRIARNDGFSSFEVRKIERLVVTHRAHLLRSWYDRFGPVP